MNKIGGIDIGRSASAKVHERYEFVSRRLSPIVKATQLSSINSTHESLCIAIQTKRTHAAVTEARATTIVDTGVVVPTVGPAIVLQATVVGFHLPHQSGNLALHAAPRRRRVVDCLVCEWIAGAACRARFPD